MAEGTSTWEGGGLPKLGEYEQIAQTAANDIVTLTGAASHTGDFWVAQNSTGAELAYIDINGGAHFAGASSFASTLTVTGALTLAASVTGTQQTLVLSATTMSAALYISVTSSGALGVKATAPSALGTVEQAVNGVVVNTSSAAVLNCAFAYRSTTDGWANTMLGILGSNAPAAFLALGATEIYQGAPIDVGTFFDASLKLNTFTCDHPFAGVKIFAGSKAFWLLAANATGVT